MIHIYSLKRRHHRNFVNTCLQNCKKHYSDRHVSTKKSYNISQLIYRRLAYVVFPILPNIRCFKILYVNLMLFVIFNFLKNYSLF